MEIQVAQSWREFSGLITFPLQVEIKFGIRLMSFAATDSKFPAVERTVPQQFYNKAREYNPTSLRPASEIFVEIIT